MIRAIRTLGLAGVETLLGWAADEGWNPGLGDAAPFYSADPDGFLGVEVDGELAGGIAATAYGTSFGFIGLFIVRPEFRGGGHGKAVWDAGMAHLAGRTVGLDGVPAQQANYQRSGFVTAYETIRMTGTLDRQLGPGIVPAEWVPAAKLRQLDRLCFPEPRDAFLSQWLAPPRTAFAAVEDGEVIGYGVVRACGEGHKIGPLYVHGRTAALNVLAALASAAGGPVSIDVPVPQKALLNELRALGFTESFATARMYFGPAPVVSAERVYGVGTLELG